MDNLINFLLVGVIPSATVFACIVVAWIIYGVCSSRFGLIEIAAAFLSALIISLPLFLLAAIAFGLKLYDLATVLMLFTVPVCVVSLVVCLVKRISVSMMARGIRSVVHREFKQGQE